jgi:putative ABC transport system ATP-binding protein
MIHLEKIQFRYPSSSNWVLDIEKFTVKKGEKVFLKGPSGSGKSTLLGLVTGVLEPQHGQVILNEVNISALSSSKRDSFRGENMGYVFQQFNLLPFLTVKENLNLAVDLNPVRKSRVFDRFKSIEQAITHYLSRLNISSLVSQNVGDLSVGQAQRVAVARALLGDPSVIIADEPTSSLDADNRNEFIELLNQEIKQTQTTLLFVSHDHTLAKHFDRSADLTEINKAFRKTS